MTISIREYATRDRETCRSLWRELTERHRDIYDSPGIGGDHPEDRFDAYLLEKNLVGPWVAVHDGEVVGMAGLLVQGTQAEIEPIVVRTGYRSRGVGGQLIERVKAEATARGVEYLSIRPVARNARAIACFHRAGFTLLGHLDMFMKFGEPDDRTWKDGIEIHGHAFRY